MTFKNSQQQGQVALIVLLLLTVSLTIGLSLIARTVNELRVTSNAERSAQAYAVAEAGVEEALVNNSLNEGDYKTLDLGDGKSAKFTITKKEEKGGDAATYVFPKTFDKDEAAQLWLFDYQSFLSDTLATDTASKFLLNPSTNTPSHNIRVYWGTQNEAGSQYLPAMEVSVISARIASGNLSQFSVVKYPFKVGTQTNNFASGTSNATVINGTTYNYYADVPLTSGGGVSPILLRLKLLYNQQKHGLAVDPNPGSTSFILPAQGSVIDSTGESGNVVRKLRVYQSYPTLPGIFDFVLFNGSNNPLEKN